MVLFLTVKVDDSVMERRGSGQHLAIRNVDRVGGDVTADRSVKTL